MEMMTEGAQVARGAFWLSLGNGLGTAISALATILIARLLGPANYGAYSAALALLGVFAASADLSLNRAATYYISQNIVRKKNSYPYALGAIFGALISGASFFAMVWFLSPMIATLIFNKAYLSRLFLVTAIIVFVVAISNASRGILLGLGRMDLIGIAAIISSIIRNTAAISLILIGLGAFGAISGQAIGYASVMVLLLFFGLYQIKKTSGFYEDDEEFSLVIRNLYSYSIPIAIFAFASAIFQQFYNILAARSLSDFVYGNFSAAWMVFGASLMFPNSLATALFPTLSKMAGVDEKAVTKNYSAAVKYASLSLLPIAVIFMSVPDELILFVYGPEYYMAGRFLYLFSIVLFLCIIGFGVTGPALLSLRRTKTLSAISLLSIMISYLYITSFTRTITAYTLILGIIIMYSLITILGLAVMWHDYGARIDWISSAKLLISALISLATIHLVKMFITNLILSLAFSVTIGTVTYLISVSMVGVLSLDDYRNLRNYSTAIPLIGKVLTLVVETMEKLSLIIRKST